MTDYVKIEDGVFAQSASPDPASTYSTEEFQELLERKQQDVIMYYRELTNLTERKATLEAEIVKIEALLAE